MPNNTAKLFFDGGSQTVCLPAELDTCEGESQERLRRRNDDRIGIRSDRLGDQWGDAVLIED